MWFWRGTQSAIFYYVSLSPCFEYSYKRKRKREASKAHKEREELRLTQPGVIHQPVPFQTNVFWAEEIATGPGPPRGWRRHSLDDVNGHGNRKKGKRKKSVFSSSAPEEKPVESDPPNTSSSTSDVQEAEIQPASARPSLWASPSGTGITLDTLKETLRSTIPETWNLKRYEREDETLFGINDKISRMWERARPASQTPGAPTTPGATSTPGGRRRATTLDSEDDPSWRYARNPGVNDLHPPTVTRLPRTQREIAWIKQPPPSRAVMEGKIRPGTESTQRRPLCVSGREAIQNETTPHTKSAGIKTVNDPAEAGYNPDSDSDLSDAEAGPANGLGEPGPSSASGAASNQSYDYDSDLYADILTPSLLFPNQPPLKQTSHPLPSPLQRPPLAVLVNSHSNLSSISARVEVRTLSSKPGSPRDSVVGVSADADAERRAQELFLGVVLPKIPGRARDRYSLPADLRVG